MLRKRVLIDGKPVVLWEQLIKPSSCKYGSTHIRLLQDVSLAPIAAVPQSEYGAAAVEDASMHAWPQLGVPRPWGVLSCAAVLKCKE